MNRMIGYMGATVCSGIGWYLGSQIGLMSGFLLSAVGAGAGLFFTRRLMRNYFDG